MTLTLVEEVRLEEDLTVCNRNDVGRNKRCNVIRLGLDDWKSSQRTTTFSGIQLRSTLEKAGVYVENVTRERFTTWWTTKEQ